MSDEPNPPISFPVLPSLRVNGARVDQERCGECVYFSPGQQLREGTCHGNPPVLVLTPKGPAAVRPAVRDRDFACRHFHK